MPDYSKCIIYTIRTPTGLYVGSTCNFTRRKCCHKSSLSNQNDSNYNNKLYQNIRENNYKWDMKPYSEYPCENKTQMTIEEERVRRELNADLNSYQCHLTDDEKREKKNKLKAIYRANNKEKITEYRKANKEKYSEYNKRCYAKKKQIESE